jgi:hypothetical protein
MDNGVEVEGNDEVGLRLFGLGWLWLGLWWWLGKKGDWAADDDMVRIG